MITSIRRLFTRKETIAKKIQDILGTNTSIVVDKIVSRDTEKVIILLQTTSIDVSNDKVTFIVDKVPNVMHPPHSEDEDVTALRALKAYIRYANHVRLFEDLRGQIFALQKSEQMPEQREEKMSVLMKRATNAQQVAGEAIHLAQILCKRLNIDQDIAKSLNKKMQHKFRTRLHHAEKFEKIDEQEWQRFIKEFKTEFDAIYAHKHIRPKADHALKTLKETQHPLLQVIHFDDVTLVDVLEQNTDATIILIR